MVIIDAKLELLMRNCGVKIFALKVTDAKFFHIENWWCEADVKFLALSFGDAKIFALRKVM